MGVTRAGEWQVVVPVKDGSRAKTRLRLPAAVDRDVVVAALAQDTISAVLATPGARCVVVTGNPTLARWSTAAGAQVLADPGHGLNAAVRAGLRHGPPGRAAALLGDLPTLRPSELAQALAACADSPGFVPDRQGTGTVLLAGPDRDRLVPRFGPGSAAAHARTASAVGLQLASLRLDVDTADDLARALRLGVGPATAAAMAEVSIAGRDEATLRETTPRETAAADWASRDPVQP